MTEDLLEYLLNVANETGLPVPVVLRHHFLEGILRRLGADESFALRGSLLTRIWAGSYPRTAADIDFLGTFPHDVEITTRRFFSRLTADIPDGITIHIPRGISRGIWLDTAFPGVRLSVVGELLGHREATTVDVGFADPLVPPAETILYPACWGEPIPVFAVHRATLAAWKLHGLSEWGEQNWRAKDVLDLWLLTVQPLPADTLAEAIRTAFVSRGDTVANAERLLRDASRWENPSAQSRWKSLFRACSSGTVPAILSHAIHDIHNRLSDALSLLRPPS